MIGVRGHGLVEIAPPQRRNHAQHLGGRQPHRSAAIKRRFGEGRRAQHRDLRLHGHQDVVRAALLHASNINLIG